MAGRGRTERPKSWANWNAHLAGKTAHPATVEGRTLAVDATGAHVKVNAATVTTADVDCTNGVIHVIDTVLIPA